MFLKFDNDMISIVKQMLRSYLIIILPRVQVRKTMQLAPPLVPNTVTAPIVSVFNGHAVFMRPIADWKTMRS